MKFTLLCLSILGLLLSSGCIATRQTAEEMRLEEQRRQAVMERERQLAEEERRRTLHLRTEEAEVQVQAMRQDMNRLRTELSQANAQDLQRMDQRISRLEAQLREMEQQRVRDREEIIQVLSARMAEVMRTQAAARPAAGGRTHVVSSGETLSAIAAAWEVSPQAIIRANNLSNPDRLRVGQSLTIP